MRRLCVVMLLLSVSGCMGASKRANELAGESAFVPVEYKNAAQPGPTVAVLLGESRGVNAMYYLSMNDPVLKDYAEIELGKAGFRVLDTEKGQDSMPLAALAARGHDTAGFAVLADGDLAQTQYLAVFDVVEASRKYLVQKGSDGIMAGAAISSLLGQRNTALGNAIEDALASIKSSENVSEWTVGIAYTVMRRDSLDVVCSGVCRTTGNARQTASGFLGAESKEDKYPSFNKIVQVAVQKCVAEIDGQKPNLPQVPQALSATKTRKDAKALRKEYTDKAAAQARDTDQDRALAVLKGFLEAYAQSDGFESMATICTEVFDDYYRKFHSHFQVPKDIPSYRQHVQYDISDVKFELLTLTENRANIRAKGNIVVDYLKKRQTFMQNYVYTMIKENGMWKTCSFPPVVKLK